MSSYVKFDLVEKKPRTAVYLVRSSFNGEALGRISWHWAWRRYGFSPIDDTVFDSACLDEIASFLKSLMKSREAGK